MTSTYDRLKEQVKKLQKEAGISRTPTKSERADWAYGNTKIENSRITRHMVENAVRTKR